jgi:type VI secretion system protein ImpE
MVKAIHLLDRGQLSLAIGQVKESLKNTPEDISTRLFLFDLLCLAGELDQSAELLGHVEDQSGAMQPAVETCSQVLAAEKARRAFFEAQGEPHFLTAPPEYAALHIEALKLQKEKRCSGASELLERALDLQPALAGEVDGEVFEEFGDADVFLGPFLEVFADRKYVWLPFEQIRWIEIIRPVESRDRIWARAKIHANAGSLGEVRLPVIYPGSSGHPDEAMKLGRLTDWIDLGEGLSRGIGQRLFLIDGQEIPMLEIEEISFSEIVEELD